MFPDVKLVKEGLSGIQIKGFSKQGKKFRIFWKLLVKTEDFKAGLACNRPDVIFVKNAVFRPADKAGKKDMFLLDTGKGFLTDGHMKDIGIDKSHFPLLKTVPSSRKEVV